MNTKLSPGYTSKFVAARLLRIYSRIIPGLTRESHFPANTSLSRAASAAKATDWCLSHQNYTSANVAWRLKRWNGFQLIKHFNAGETLSQEETQFRYASLYLRLFDLRRAMDPPGRIKSFRKDESLALKQVTMISVVSADDKALQRS
jgi:hypothetical protein